MNFPARSSSDIIYIDLGNGAVLCTPLGLNLIKCLCRAVCKNKYMCNTFLLTFDELLFDVGSSQPAITSRRSSSNPPTEGVSCLRQALSLGPIFSLHSATFCTRFSTVCLHSFEYSSPHPLVLIV